MSQLVYAEGSLIEAVERVLRTLKNTVISTFGPEGQLVVIDVPGSHVPLVTKDGVTVAEYLHSDVVQEEMILSLIKESARKTAVEQGDGTTTSTLLAVSIIDFLKKTRITKSVIDGMLHAINFVYQTLEESRIECKDNEEALLSVINISSNGDKNIVNLLTQVIQEVGADGIINVEKTESSETTVEYNEGATMTSAAVPGLGKNNVWERENVYSLLIEGRIEFAHQLTPVLKAIRDFGIKNNNVTPLIIVAQEFSEEVKHAISVNNNRNLTDVSLVDAEGFGKTRLDILEDIALISDSAIVSTNGSTSNRLLDFTLSDLGKFEKAIVTPIETTLYPLQDVDITIRGIREDELRDRYKELKDNPSTTIAAEFANVERQLAKFAKVATIKVGGYTEAETNERKDRFDDAICAVVSAYNGGVLPGGGSSLFRAGQELKKAIGINDIPYTMTTKPGVDAIISMCDAPIELLSKTSGIDISGYMERLAETSTVVDFENNEIGDAMSLGIVDPYKVTITALHNALSVAKTILKTSSMITYSREK